MSGEAVSSTRTSLRPEVIIKTPSTTKESITTVTHIREQVEVIRSNPEPEATPSAKNKGSSCPDFIIRNDKGIFIELDKLPNQEAFLDFVNDVFMRGYYFTDLQYPTLTAAMYNFSKIAEYRKDKIDAGVRPRARIASGIKKFDTERVSLYEAPRVFGKGMGATYPFAFPLVKRDGTQTEEKMNIDEFVAAMWRRGIRFGLAIDTIQEIIELEKTDTDVIARGRNCISWEAARMEPIVDLDVDRRVRDGDSTGQVDIHKLEQSHAEVKEGACLYKRIPQKDGKSGWTVRGTRIEPPKLPSYPTNYYKGKGVRVEMIDGEEYLVADRDGCPWETKRNLVRDGKVVGEINQVHVRTEIVFHEIGKRTWSIITNSDVFSKNSITRDTEGKNVTTEQDVETANVRASENVNVRGNVFGSIVSGSWKVSVTQKWRVVSDTGSISIGKIAQNAYLEARNGTVRAWDMEKTTARAKRVEVAGDAVNCTFIADEVIVKGKIIGCRIISGRSISIQESAGRGSQENTLSLFSVDLKDSIAEKQKRLEIEKAAVEKIEDGVDAILKNSPRLAGVSKQRRLQLTAIVMKILLNRSLLEDPRYSSAVVLFRETNAILNQVNPRDWTRLQEYRESIKELSEEITQETAAMEWTQKDLHIEIGDIQCHTHIQWIKFPQNKRLLDLTSEELDAITASLNKPNTTVPYELEKIPSPTKWPFEWQSA